MITLRALKKQTKSTRMQGQSAGTRFVFFSLMLLMSATLTACFSTEVQRFKALSPLSVNQDYYLNTYIGGGWYGPNALDYGRTSSGVNDAGVALVGSFEIYGNSTTVSLMGTFCVSSSCTGTGDFNLLLLGYSPFTQWGEGWEGAHTQVTTAVNQASQTVFAATSDRSYAIYGYQPVGTNGVWYHSNLSTETSTLLATTDLTDSLGVEGPFPTEPTDGISLAWAGTGSFVSAMIDTSTSTGARAKRWEVTHSTPALTLDGSYSLSPSATEVHVHSDGDSAVAVMKIPHLAPSGTLNKGDVEPASVQLSAGVDFTCMLVAGEVWCAGANSVGQLGNDNSGTDSDTYVKVSGLDGVQIQAITAGYQHACALATSGGIYCWGEGSAGQLGNDASADSDVPVAVLDSNLANVTGMVAVSAGRLHTCALALSESIYCWGENGNKQLGTGDTTDLDTVSTAVMTYDDFVDVKASETHSCGIRSDRSVVCWGMDDVQQLGNGNGDTADSDPVAMTGSLTASTLTLGQDHTCFSDGGGEASCFGSDASLQLGDSATGNQNSPVSVTNLTAAADLTGVLEVKSGLVSTCARKSDKTVVCWGVGTGGELGNAATADSGIPVTVSGVTGVTHLSDGWAASHRCAVDVLGKIFCWGTNSAEGKMGTGPFAGFNPRGIPTELTKDYLACAVDSSDTDTNCLRVVNIDADGVRSNAKTLSTQWVTPEHTSGNKVESYTQASDEAGTLLIAFLAKDPTVTSCSVTNCDVRPYVAVKNASGVWGNPARIDQADVPFSTGYSSSYVDSATYSVSSYAVPQVSYLGEGAFLVAYVVADIANDVSYVMGRTYSLGSGWSATSMTLDSRDLVTYGSDQGRAVHDVKVLGSNGTVAVAIRPTTDAGELSLAVTSYHASYRWTSTTAISGYTCELSASPNDCLDFNAKAYFFDSDEGVFIFKGGDLLEDGLAATSRLWGIEFHRD